VIEKPPAKGFKMFGNKVKLGISKIFAKKESHHEAPIQYEENKEELEQKEKHSFE